MNIKGVLTIEKPPKNHLKSDIFKKSNRREKASRLPQIERFIFAMGIT